jgi:hypothetical protein
MSISTRRLQRSSGAVAGARLYLTPASGSYVNGGTLVIDIREDSGLVAVNAVQANLTYPTAQLLFQSVTTSGGAFTTTIENSGGSGVINLGVGLLASSVTGDQLVGTITFSIVGAGTPTVAFDTGSGIARESDSTDICDQKDGGTYTIT